MRRRFVNALRGFGRRPWWAACVLVMALYALSPRGMERLEGLWSDLLLPELEGPPASRILGIDESALQRWGRWPWDRGVHADMLARLKSVGVRAVGYNVLFSESASAAGDRALGEVIGTMEAQVVLPVATELDAQARLVPRVALPEIQRGAGVGHVDVPVEADGRVRRLWLFSGPQGQVPAFAWAVRQAAATEAAQPPGWSAADEARASSTQGWWRTHEVLIPPLSQPVPVESFDPRAADVSGWRGRVVFVGPTAVGLGPAYAIAGVARPVPAVVLMAHAFEVLQAGRAVAVLPAGLQALGTLFLLLPLLAWRSHTQGWRAVGPPMSLLVAPLLAAGLARWPGVWLDPTPAWLVTAVALAIWVGVALRQRARDASISRGDADAVLAAIDEGVVMLDREGKVRRVNPAAARMIDGGGDPIGRDFSEVFKLWDAQGQPLDASGAGMAIGHRPSPAAAQTPMHVLLSSTPVVRAHETDGGRVLTLRDVSDMVQANQKAMHAATHDALTGLPNRYLLLDRLRHALERANREGDTLAVLFLDIDRFKRINDSLGHAQGDELLREVARRLRAEVRAQDTVARWGGDEFVVVLEGARNREGVVQAVGKMLERLAGEFYLSGLKLRSACSIGVALAPDDASEAEALLAMADAAMYRAKAHPARRWEFYAESLDQWTRDRMALEADLRAALQSDGFELHYQPQLRLTDGRTMGLEALLRWRRPDGRLEQPATFLPVAEESSLILDLGAWVIHRSTEQIARWSRDGGPQVPVSINVSARQCLDQGLVDALRWSLKNTGVEARRLKIEITETAAMTDPLQVRELLEEVDRMGVGIALDDFGTGYSSLVHLRRLPIQQIKIDRSFVHDLEHDAEDAAIVQAIIAMSRSLHLPVVAEGVETLAQGRRLADMGCELAQGYLYARPMRAEDLALHGGVVRI